MLMTTQILKINKIICKLGDIIDTAKNHKASVKKTISKKEKILSYSSPDARSIDYKDIKTLSRFVSERGKIIPSRI